MQCIIIHYHTYNNSKHVLYIEPSALEVNIKRNINLSVSVQWDEVDDSLSTNYTVTWTNDVTKPVQSNTLIEQSPYTITGLTLDTVYTITVIATNMCGNGPEYSTSVLFPTGMYYIVSITIGVIYESLTYV